MPQTPAGAVRGVREHGVSTYKGIPYAGSTARFRPPGPVAPWTGIRDAVAFGPNAPQVGAPGEEHGCLSLNVWTPAPDGRLPVLVWLHGGRYLNGSGADPLFDGTRLASTGEAVVVTINYRLGVFGFLHLGDDHPSSGTVGLQDQIAALRWVRDSISEFGGDPGNVTVFGESAGGSSVLALLTMPAADGLFHRAIAQSPPAERVYDHDQADRVTRRVIELAGVARAADLVTMPAEALLDAQRRLLDEHPGPGSAQPLRPVFAAADQPLAAVRAGRYHDVPVLLGTNRDEGGLSIGEPWFPAIEERFGAGAVPYLTETEYLNPTIRCAEALRATGGRVWSYLFGWAPDHPGSRGACHSIEIPFVFGTQGRPEAAELCGPRPPAALADRIGRIWRDFARTGDPGWPPYRQAMVFGTEDELAADPHREVRERLFPDIS